jgi:hypothetical protein
MSLTLAGTISKSDIQSVTQKTGNVFCLRGPSGSLIVKAEKNLNAKPAHAIFGAKFMNAVDPFARSKILTTNEISALKDWVAAETLGPGNELRKILSAGYLVWRKMENRDSLISLQDAVKEREESHDKTKIRRIAAALNAPKGLERLGEIAAADLFNSNSDRFVPNNPNNPMSPWSLKDSTTQYAVKTLTNVDNVLLALEGRNLRPIGLDAFDTSSVYNDHIKPLNKIERDSVAHWPGRMLAANKIADRMTFARDIVDDLETLLGPRDRKLPFTNTHRLSSDAARRIYKGMDSGVAKIKERLRKYLESDKRQNDRVPPGVIDRASALGWLERRFTVHGKDLGVFWRR